jgi:hypothetical protein
MALLIMAIFFMIWVPRFALSKFYEAANPINVQNITLSCKLFPGNWRACCTKARLEIVHSNLDDAEKTLLEILARQRLNFPALRTLVNVYQLKGNFVKSCDVARIYHGLFGLKSSLSTFIEAYCIPLEELGISWIFSDSYKDFHLNFTNPDPVL